VGQSLLIVEVCRSHSAGHITVGRTPLDGWSARRREFHLTTHNTQHSQQTNIHNSCGIQNRNPIKRSAPTHTLDRGRWDRLYKITGTYWLTWYFGSLKLFSIRHQILVQRSSSRQKIARIAERKSTPKHSVYCPSCHINTYRCTQRYIRASSIINVLNSLVFMHNV